MKAVPAMLRIKLTSAPVLCILVISPGCEKKPSAAPVVQVPCRIVIVLKPGENVGGVNNIGCRLSEQQVLDYMQALNSYGPRYGHNVQFVHNPPEVWESTNLTVRPHSLIAWWSLDMNPNSQTNDPLYDDTKINIYFVGDVRDPNAPQATYNGNTTDALNATECPNLPLRAHFFIGDRAWLNNGQPLLAPGDRVLEHEMCHFLIRQYGARPPLVVNQIPVCPALPAEGTRGYDATEHDPGSSHLMRPSTPHGDISTQDAKECSTRVINNLFLLP